MNLTVHESDSLKAILWEIRRRAGKKVIPRHTIENLCDKAFMIMKKAGRKTTRLHFEQGDFD